MIKYKSWRLVNGKPGWIIIDDSGDIINNNPSKEELESCSIDIIPARRLIDFDILEKQYGKDFVDWVRKNKGKVRKCVINAGCKTETEYLHKCAQRSGFKDYNERQKLRSWKNGKKSPADANSDCSSYLSNKTEEYFKEYLLNYFEYVEGSGKGSWDGGIDLYCKNPKQKSIGKYQLEVDKEYRFQVKSRCLEYVPEYDPYWSKWKFPIRTNKNNVPDFWIFVGLRDREDIENGIKPEHSWVIHRDEIIDNRVTKGKKLYERDTISIANSKKVLYKYREYELA